MKMLLSSFLPLLIAGITASVGAVLGMILGGPPLAMFLSGVFGFLSFIVTFLTGKLFNQLVSIAKQNSEMYDMIKKLVGGTLGAILDQVIGIIYIFMQWVRSKLPEGLIAFLDDPIPFLKDKIQEAWEKATAFMTMDASTLFTAEGITSFWTDFTSLKPQLEFPDFIKTDVNFALGLGDYVHIAGASKWKITDLLNTDTEQGLSLAGTLKPIDRWKITDLIEVDTIDLTELSNKVSLGMPKIDLDIGVAFSKIKEFGDKLIDDIEDYIKDKSGGLIDLDINNNGG